MAGTKNMCVITNEITYSPPKPLPLLAPPLYKRKKVYAFNTFFLPKIFVLSFFFANSFVSPQDGLVKMRND